MKTSNAAIIVNGKVMKIIDSEFTENINFKVTKKGELYLHKIYDSNNSGRRIEFTAQKDFSAFLQKEVNKVTLNGVDAFDDSLWIKRTH